MKRQSSFADSEYAGRRKATRREVFLSELDRLVPWSALIGLIEPHYYKGARGRPPVGLELMLRMYLCQNCLGLSDEGIEDAIVDSIAVRRFVGIDLFERHAPGAPTLLKFRRLLEANDLPASLFALIREHLGQQGLILREGTIVDATLIAAPPSTKNREHARDADMHQVKKGNQWHFGMKAHIGAVAHTGLVHTMVTTSANEPDVAHMHRVLHGHEKVVHGDAGYQGVQKRAELKGCDAELVIARRRSTYQKLDACEPSRTLIRKVEHAKASLRAKVEHIFHVVKNLFHHRKCRYKGLAKNTAHMNTLFAMANLMLSRRKLCVLGGTVAP